MTPGWLINRLKLMSFGEVFYRVKQVVGNQVEKVRLGYGWEPEIDTPVSTRLEIIDKGLLSSFPWPDYSSPAKSLATGKLSLFEYENLDIGWPINWHRDPLTGIAAAAQQYGKTIDYRDDAQVGDIKVLWELGRQQFLVAVAIEYSQRQEQSQLDTIAGVIDSWLQQNPYGYGVHWCSSLEVAIRGLSWCITHQLLLASGLPKGLFSLDLDAPVLQKQIYQHAAFIRSHLSLYSSANNHLIGELTGLHALCALFDFGSKSEQWQDFAWQSLLLESDRQVYRDGVNKEQAIYYHCWVLEYFLINYLIAGHSGQMIPDDYVSQLSRMAQFVRDLSPLATAPPQIGDADDGVAIQFSSVASPFHRDLIEAIDTIAGSLPRGAGGIKAFCYRLLYKEGSWTTPAAVANTSYPSSYPEGGYGILGTPKFHVVFDCGSLGYPGIAAHGHADMLNMCLAIDGLWWLIDPGTYSYHSDHNWRDYFRGSSAHNVVSINHRDQSEIGGPFMWIRHAKARFQEASCIMDGVHEVSGWHDGYTGEGAPRVARTLQVNTANEEVLIHDEVECSGEVQVDIHFHFLPDIRCVELQGSRVLLEKMGTDTRIQLEFPDKLAVTRYHGDQKTLLGWYSSNLGKKEPCLTLQASTKISSTTRFTTCLTVQRGQRGK